MSQFNALLEQLPPTPSPVKGYLAHSFVGNGDARIIDLYGRVDAPCPYPVQRLQRVKVADDPYVEGYLTNASPPHSASYFYCSQAQQPSLWATPIIRLADKSRLDTVERQVAFYALILSVLHSPW